MGKSKKFYRKKQRNNKKASKSRKKKQRNNKKKAVADLNNRDAFFKDLENVDKPSPTVPAPEEYCCAVNFKSLATLKGTSDTNDGLDIYDNTEVVYKPPVPAPEEYRGPIIFHPLADSGRSFCHTYLQPQFTRPPVINCTSDTKDGLDIYDNTEVGYKPPVPAPEEYRGPIIFHPLADSGRSFCHTYLQPQFTRPPVINCTSDTKDGLDIYDNTEVGYKPPVPAPEEYRGPIIFHPLADSGRSFCHTYLQPQFTRPPVINCTSDTKDGLDIYDNTEVVYKPLVPAPEEYHGPIIFHALAASGSSFCHTYLQPQFTRPPVINSTSDTKDGLDFYENTEVVYKPPVPAPEEFAAL
uniref:Uncharacterized protein n=1 Tax=Daucus carota subsp. sativus TaxID=79200 RepID=A0A175YCK7_DAUCS